MGETFYTILDVSKDADQETIRRAYREQVKESHPDVSDSPDASRRFKRLTTARDVLVDDDERRRYDRLGHDTYVRQHVETPVWTASTPDDQRSAGVGGPGTGGSRRTSQSGSAGRYTSQSESDGGWTAGQHGHHATSRERRQAAEGGRTTAGRATSDGTTTRSGYGASWQRAPDSYMRSEGFAESGTPGRTLGESLRGLGPWLFVHGVLLTSAVGTGAFVFMGALTNPSISLPAALFLIVMLSLVVLISILHLVTEAYA